jgi:hypothetical protein
MHITRPSTIKAIFFRLARFYRENGSDDLKRFARDPAKSDAIEKTPDGLADIDGCLENLSLENEFTDDSLERGC